MEDRKNSGYRKKITGHRKEEYMIITVTLNPAMDKTITVEKLQVGELNKVLSVREDVGGKGINVSKTLKSFGAESIAVGFLGGAAGSRIRDVLHEKKIEEHFTGIKNETRTNLKVADREGCVTEINEAGPIIEETEVCAFCEMLEEILKQGKVSATEKMPDTQEKTDAKDLVVFSGSMPNGMPVDFYRQMIEKVHELGAEAFLDADGAAFLEGMKARPDIVKPNLQELIRYIAAQKESTAAADRTGSQESTAAADRTGSQESTADPDSKENMIREALSMGKVLQKQGVPEVLISMGGDGALFITEQGSYYAPALSVPVCSTVGAGDAMVAAYAYVRAQKKTMEERIRFCMAVSAGAVTTQGTNPAETSLIENLLGRVQIRKLA